MSKVTDRIQSEIERDPEMRVLYEKEKLKLEIADLIFDLRAQTGLSQTEFAKKVHKSRSTIARIEAGQMEASLSTLVDITTALNKQFTFKVEDKPLEKSH